MKSSIEMFEVCQTDKWFFGVLHGQSLSFVRGLLHSDSPRTISLTRSLLGYGAARQS